jgi:hypothetical protein
MDDVLRRPRTSGQAPGQSVGVLTSPPASGLPSLLELDHTVPAPQGHSTLHPNRTIHRAHGGPPDRVELLQRVGRRCHGRIILISDNTCKSLLGRLGRAGLSQHPMTLWARALLLGSNGLGARSRVAEGMPGLRPHDDGDTEQVAAGMGFDLVEGAYDIR